MDIIASGDYGRDDGIICDCGSKTYLVYDQGYGLKSYQCENSDCEYSEHSFQVQYELDDWEETDDDFLWDFESEL